MGAPVASNVLHKEHWAAWAVWRRQLPWGLRLGFPKAATFQKGSSTYPPRELSDNEIIVARVIDRGVQALGAGDPERGRLLREFHGAYIGAPVARKHRMHRIAPFYGSRPAIYLAVDLAEQWVSGWVERDLHPPRV